MQTYTHTITQILRHNLIYIDIDTGSKESQTDQTLRKVPKVTMKSFSRSIYNYTVWIILNPAEKFSIIERSSFCQRSFIPKVSVDKCNKKANVRDAFFSAAVTTN